MGKNIVIVNGIFNVVDSSQTPIDLFEENILSALFQNKSHHCNLIFPENSEDPIKYTVSFDTGTDFSSTELVSFRLITKVDNVYYSIISNQIQPIDFLQDIIYQDLTFTIRGDYNESSTDDGGDKGCVLPLGVDPDGNSAFEPCALYQPIADNICENGEFPIRLSEDPSPIVDISYVDIDKISLNITPKDTTEYCSTKEEFECVTDDSCIWDSTECLGKQYPIERITMGFDLIILDKNKLFIDNTGSELNGISIIGDSGISIEYGEAAGDTTLPLSILFYHKDIIKKNVSIINSELIYSDLYGGNASQTIPIETKPEMSFTLSDTQWDSQNERLIELIYELNPGENYVSFPVTYGVDGNQDLEDIIFPGDRESFIPTNCGPEGVGWDCGSNEYCNTLSESECVGGDSRPYCYWTGDLCEVQLMNTNGYNHLPGQQVIKTPILSIRHGGLATNWTIVAGSGYGWYGNLINILEPVTDSNDVPRVGYRFLNVGSNSTSDSFYFKLTGNGHFFNSSITQRSPIKGGDDVPREEVGIKPPCKDYIYRPLNTLESLYGPEDEGESWKVALDSIHHEGALVNTVDYTGNNIADGFLGTLVELYVGYGYQIIPKPGNFLTKVYFDAVYDDCNICSDGDTGHEYNSEIDVFAEDKLLGGTFDNTEDCCHFPYQVETFYEQLYSDDDYGRVWLDTKQICTVFGEGPVEYDDGSGVKTYYKRGSECEENESEDLFGNCIGPLETGAKVDRLGNICYIGSMDLCGICFGDSSQCQEQLNQCAFYAEESTVSLSNINITEDTVLTQQSEAFTPIVNEFEIGIGSSVPLHSFSFDITSIEPMFSEENPIVRFKVGSYDNFVLSINQYDDSSGNYKTTVGGFVLYDDLNLEQGEAIIITYSDFKYSDTLEILNLQFNYILNDVTTSFQNQLVQVDNLNIVNLPITLNEIYGCLDTNAINYNSNATNDCVGTSSESYICCEYFWNYFEPGSPYNIGGVSHITYEWTDGNVYVDLDAENISFFEDLGIGSNTENTIGDNSYAIYDWTDGNEYVDLYTENISFFEGLEIGDNVENVINDNSYAIYTWVEGYEYEATDISNIEYFEGLSIGSNAQNTIGDNSYAIYTWVEDNEYVDLDAENISYFNALDKSAIGDAGDDSGTNIAVNVDGVDYVIYPWQTGYEYEFADDPAQEGEFVPYLDFLNAFLYGIFEEPGADDEYDWTDTCGGSEFCFNFISTGDFGRYYLSFVNTEAVAGFQFTFGLDCIQEVISDGYAADNNGFLISSISNSILGFSLTDGLIQPTEDILFEIDCGGDCLACFTYEDNHFNDDSVMVSDSFGNELTSLLAEEPDAEATPYEGFDDLDNWLMTSNSGNPIEDLPTLLNDTLAVYGGGPAEPIDLPTFEVPGPYTENVEVNQINGTINFGTRPYVYTLDRTISIGTFEDYYFSENPDIYYEETECEEAGGITCPDAGYSFRECAELGCFDDIKMELLFFDFFIVVDGTINRNIAFFNSDVWIIGTEDGTWGNGDPGECESHIEGLENDCFTKYFIFEFQPQVRDDGNYGFVKFY